MRWTEAAPTALALAALVYVPGALALRGLGVRGLLALVGAPAACSAVLAVGAVAFDVLGLRWAPATVALLLAAAVVVCWAVGRLSHRRGLGLDPLPSAWMVAATAATVFAAVVQLYAFVLGMGGPDAVQQVYDPIFHLNAADTILRTGNASSFGGLDPMYGDRTGMFYPAVWPSIVALGATVSDVVVASNMLMLLTGVLVWLVGLVALARAVVPRHRLVAVAAPVVASSFLAFPANLHVLQGMYGYSFAIALWPGVLAVVVTALRRPSGPGLLAAALGAAGLVAVHPSAVMLLAVSVLPLVGHHAHRWGRELVRRQRRLAGGALIGVVPAAAAGLAAAIYTVPQLRAMGAFDHPGGDPWLALRTGLLTSTTVGWTSPWANVVIAVLILLGAVVAWRAAATRWLTTGWAVTLGLFVIAAGPETPLRQLTALWYKNPDRPLAMLPLFGALLGAIGTLAVARLAARVAERRTGRPADRAGVLAAVAVLAVAFVTSGAFRTQERLYGWTWWAFNPDHPLVTTYASREELELLRDLPVPDDAVVIGDPHSGEVFVQSVGDAIAYIPHINPSSWDATQRFLMESFADIHTDPAVCDAVRDQGIEYYYADEPPDPRWEERAPGLYGVDTSTGFELLGRGGTARVYRITACS